MLRGFFTEAQLGQFMDPNTFLLNICQLVNVFKNTMTKWTCDSIGCHLVVWLTTFFSQCHAIYYHRLLNNEFPLPKDTEK